MTEQPVETVDLKEINATLKEILQALRELADAMRSYVPPSDSAKNFLNP